MAPEARLRLTGDEWHVLFLWNMMMQIRRDISYVSIIYIQ